MFGSVLMDSEPILTSQPPNCLGVTVCPSEQLHTARGQQQHHPLHCIGVPIGVMPGARYGAVSHHKRTGLNKKPHATTPCSVTRLSQILEDRDVQLHLHPHGQTTALLQPLVIELTSWHHVMLNLPPPQRPTEEQAGPSYAPTLCKRKRRVPKKEGEHRASPVHLPEGILAVEAEAPAWWEIAPAPPQSWCYPH